MYKYSPEPPLPRERVVCERAFSCVIDYAGPMFIKNIYRRDNHLYKSWIPRNGSTAAAASKMERFVIANGFQPLTIITKRSILDVAAALDRF